MTFSPITTSDPILTTIPEALTVLPTLTQIVTSTDDVVTVPTIENPTIPTIQAIPSSTLKPFTAPTTWSRVTNYEISWLVPTEWVSVGEQLSSSVSNSILIYASANSEITSLLPFSASSSFPDGLMLMTLQAEFAPRSQPPGVETVSVSGYSGWIFKVTGDEADPFLLRTTLFLQTPANSYSVLFDCTPPNTLESDQVDYKTLCQDVWDQIVAGVEVLDSQLATECPIISTPTPGLMNWRQISSSWVKYIFEVPTSWLEQRGPTPDRLTFLSDPAIIGQPDFCSLPNGLMKLDFTANPVGSGALNLQGFTRVTIGDQSAWVITRQEGDSTNLSSIGIQGYIQGIEYWYGLGLQCVPQTGADADTQIRFAVECEATFNHILNSFQTNP